MTAPSPNSNPREVPIDASRYIAVEGSGVSGVPNTNSRRTDVGWMGLLPRIAVVGAHSAYCFLVGGIVASGLMVTRGEHAARRHLCRRLTRLIERLGPAFIKGGQILSTRRDVLPAVLCDALASLQDSTEPIRDPRGALAEAYGSALEATFEHVDYQAVASGSVACVYRARLRGGDVVAIKLRRPGIEKVMSVDLAIVNRVGTWVAQLPAMRGVPVRAVLDHLTEAIYAQLDFAREAQSLARLRTSLTSDSEVRVPRIESQACRGAAVVMEFVDGLDKQASTRTEDAVRSRLAATALTAVYRMIFVDGFVHCDLHPGNLYFTEQGQVVVLDAGFSAELTHRMRRLFAEFFKEMSVGHGERCAELVIESAQGASDDADLEGFRVRMADLVHRNARRAAKDFSLIGFAAEMFDLQRQHHIHAAPELLFPLLSLLVIEGTIRSLDPALDFQQLAQPVVMQALLGGAQPWAQSFLVKAAYP